MTYDPPNRAAARVEVMSFGHLRVINDRTSQRTDFHVLAIVEAGNGAITVDFSRYALAPHSAVWVTPGAVHQWDDIAGVEGELFLFVPTAPVTHSTRSLVESSDLGPQWMISDSEWPLVELAQSHLIIEAAAAEREDGTEIPDILLSALIARLRPPHKPARADDPTFRLFQKSVDTHFREHHDAEYYAGALGYSPRTLSRVVQKATGRTAKAFVVDRLVLEAKRLLVHDRFTAARCATALGFSDPSNFSGFFENATGMRPGAWQEQMTTQAR